MFLTVKTLHYCWIIIQLLKILISIAFLGKYINAEISKKVVSNNFFYGNLPYLMLYLSFFIHTPNCPKSYLQEVIVNYFDSISIFSIIKRKKQGSWCNYVQNMTKNVIIVISWLIDIILNILDKISWYYLKSMIGAHHFPFFIWMSLLLNQKIIF